jgi:chemotaxis protein MotB
MESPQPIIVIKKKAKHGGHHGGAWKVAYADFVTAMMALFIVLWLMNSSKQLQQAVGGYFKDPTGTSKKVGTNQQGSGENLLVTKTNMSELREQITKSLRQLSDFEKLKDHIDMTVTAEGLRIEMMESKTGTFFDTGKPEPNIYGRELLVMLAQEVKGLPNKIALEGHTDANPYSGGGAYGNWELSADRSNAARRLMEQSGLSPDQISEVRGYADRRLRNSKDPLDPSNRRISLIVQYLPQENAAEDASPEKATGKESESAVAKPPAGHPKAEESSHK